MKRALAIFAKTPQPGFVKTRLTPPLTPLQAAGLYRCMLLDTVQRVQALGVDTFVFYDGDKEFFSSMAGTTVYPQEGNDLGTRLENSFSLLASIGYRARAVIGSDAPDLPLPFIADAFILMDAGKEVVFGPAEDGGYYLVSLSGSYGSVFRDIPWSGARVLETSMERARESALDAALLPSWYDIDGYDDLYRPGLLDPDNGAPLTRDFITNLGITPLDTTGAVEASAR